MVEPLIIISTYLRDSVECGVGGAALTHHSDVSSSLLTPLSPSTRLQPEQLTRLPLLKTVITSGTAEISAN